MGGEQATLEGLTTASNDNDIDHLKIFIAEAQNLRFSPPELSHAQQLLPKLKTQLEARVLPCLCFCSLAVPLGCSFACLDFFFVGRLLLD